MSEYETNPPHNDGKYQDFVDAALAHLRDQPHTLQENQLDAMVVSAGTEEVAAKAKKTTIEDELFQRIGISICRSKT